jgi:hypothetical protein
MAARFCVFLPSILYSKYKHIKVFNKFLLKDLAACIILIISLYLRYWLPGVLPWWFSSISYKPEIPLQEGYLKSAGI